MFRLLNRLAWFVSFLMGYFILYFVVYFFFPYPFSGSGVLLLFPLLGLAIKGAFFSKSYIQRQINTFAETIIWESSQASISQTESQDTENTLEMEAEEPDATEENTQIQNQDTSEKSPDTSQQEQTIPAYTVAKTDTLRNQSVEGIPEKKPKEPSAFSKAIQWFFSENLLAKIGWILLFLGVLFFLNLIYTSVGPVAKIIIGILFWFLVYGAWVYLDKKWFTSESRILLGLWILINYLVILSGRYIIWGDGWADQGMFSVGITFLFLILNTIFWILTSLVYQSRSLLIFSFVFAYLNPLLVGGSSDTPYVVLGYSTIVSMTGIALAWSKKFQNDVQSLLAITFIWGQSLYFLAPFDDVYWWIAKLVCFTGLSILVIYSAYKKKAPNLIPYGIIASYMLLLWYVYLLNGTTGSMSWDTMTYIMALAPLILISATLQFFEKKEVITSDIATSISVLIGIVGLCIIPVFSIDLSVWTVLVVSLIYLSRLRHDVDANNPKMAYITSGILWIFLLFAHGIIFSSSGSSFVQIFSHPSQYIAFIGVVLLFLFVTYYFATKKWFSYLYMIGTLGFIINMMPMIVITPVSVEMFVSVMALFIFWWANIMLPFFQRDFFTDKQSFYSFILSLVFWLLFVVFNVYNYMSFYYPWVTVWFALAWVGIIYFFVTYVAFTALDVNIKDNSKDSALSRDMILAYGFASLSVLSLSVAFVFAQRPEVVTVVWIFESMLLLYFYNSTKDYKVYIASMILLAIGVINLSRLFSTTSPWEYGLLISMAIIFVSLLVGSKAIKDDTNPNVRIPHDVLHILAMLVLVFMVQVIFSRAQYGFEALAVSIYIALLAAWYRFICSSDIQRNFIVFLIGMFAIFHIYFVWLAHSPYIYTRLVQYITTAIIGATWYTFARSCLVDIPKYTLLVITSLYLFVITTFYVQEIFANTFAVTIYWSLLAFSFLITGISRDNIKYRTIWLYILFLALTKILLYDIWVGLDDSALRVWALMIVGIMMIFISIMYSKKYGNNLKWEFNLNNLK